MSFKSIRLYQVFLFIKFGFRQASVRAGSAADETFRAFAPKSQSQSHVPIVPKGKAKLSSRAQLYPKGKR